MTKCWLFTLTLVIAIATGCGQSVSAPTSAAARVGSTALTAALPSLSGATGKSSTPPPAEPALTHGVPKDAEVTQPSSTPTPVTAIPEMGELFAPPKIVDSPAPKEPERGPEPTVETPKDPLPQVRLIGFVEVEGLKALLSIEGKLNVVSVGDSTERMQVIAIEPPAVTLKCGEDGEEFQINLYDQPWFHQPSTLPDEHKMSAGKPGVPRGLVNPPLPGPGGGARAPEVPGASHGRASATPSTLSVPGFRGTNGPPSIPTVGSGLEASLNGKSSK